MSITQKPAARRKVPSVISGKLKLNFLPEEEKPLPHNGYPSICMKKEFQKQFPEHCFLSVKLPENGKLFFDLGGFENFFIDSIRGSFGTSFSGVMYSFVFWWNSPSLSSTI